MKTPTKKPDYEDNRIKGWNDTAKSPVKEIGFKATINGEEWSLTGFNEMKNKDGIVILLVKLKSDLNGGWLLFHPLNIEGEILIEAMKLSCLKITGRPLKYTLFSNYTEHIKNIKKVVESSSIDSKTMK